MDHSETISEIIIVHRDRNFATEIRNRLESSGYAVAKIADDLSRVEMGGDKVVLIEAELWDSERVPVARIVLLALPEYDAGSAKQLPDAIVYLPLRGRELENALALAERKTEVTNERLLVETLRHYGLFLLDRNGFIRSWSPGAKEVHGYEHGDIVGKHFGILYTDEDLANNIPGTELRIAEREGYADDTRWLKRRDGERFWAEGLTTAVKDPKGEILAFSKLTRDATERRQLELKLERSNDELQRFAYTVSHDLQEPLRTVRSYAELFSRRYAGKFDADADEFIRFMMDAAGRMSQLLKDLLAYSQAGRPDRTVPEPTSSANILQWAIMNVERLAKEANATITYDSLPMVEADQTQLSQVFQNLLGNAIKYRSAEPPNIHVSAMRVDNFYEFAVKDNGIGVDPEHHERIFGVFKRLHGKEVPGTGIGLAICRKIIDSHGGRIWIESELKRGATVKFTLPAHD